MSEDYDRIDARKLPEPSEHTVGEVKDAVRDADLTDKELGALLAQERRKDDRVTLTEWLESQGADTSVEAHPDADDIEPPESAVELAPDDLDSPADPADAAPSRQGPPRETDAPTLGDDDYDPASDNAWAPGEVPNPDDIPLVVVRSTRVGHCAGYYFEAAGQTRVVARNRRVDDAIVDGELRYVRPAPDGAEDGDRL